MKIAFYIIASNLLVESIIRCNINTTLYRSLITRTHTHFHKGTLTHSLIQSFPYSGLEWHNKAKLHLMSISRELGILQRGKQKQRQISLDEVIVFASRNSLFLACIFTMQYTIHTTHSQFLNMMNKWKTGHNSAIIANSTRYTHLGNRFTCITSKSWFLKLTIFIEIDVYFHWFNY